MYDRATAQGGQYQGFLSPFLGHLIFFSCMVFRIPVNPNQTVDNVKVEDQKNVDVKSSESDGKVNDDCLHVVLKDQRVEPVESRPVIDKKSYMR